MGKIKFFMVRLYVYTLLVLFFLTGGLSMFILAPLYKHAFVPNARLKDIKILALWRHAYKIMWRNLTDKNYQAAFSVEMGGAPKIHTDRTLVRVKQSWAGGPDDCDLCGALCCTSLDCPLLDKNKRCMSYNSLFFGYLNCGRYPENQKQIDYYQCPKWEVNNTEN